LEIVILTMILRLFLRLKLKEREVCLLLLLVYRPNDYIYTSSPTIFALLGFKDNFAFECVEHVEAPLNVDYRNDVLN
jgi:hypothetical protein